MTRLTTKQIEHLERRLKDERERALTALNRSVSDISGESPQDRSGDLTKLPLHPADLGTDTMQIEMTAVNASRITEELTEIDAALARLYKNPESYGLSESTGEAIPFERLDAIPWART